MPMPPLAEQRRIAAVLDAIDDAIERSEAVIAATEELRRSLLHELLSRGVPGLALGVAGGAGSGGRAGVLGGRPVGGGVRAPRVRGRRPSEAIRSRAAPLRADHRHYRRWPAPTR